MNALKNLRGMGPLCLLLALIAWSASAEDVKVDVAVDTPAVLAKGKPVVHLRVALTGGDIRAGNTRPPVNVCLVIDKSGSMTGAKLEKAKMSALMALERLSGEDIVSVVAYSSAVNVLVPATRASDRAFIVNAINSIQPDGSTALFAGVSKGAEELRKFLDKNRVNRIVLLSDGIANVGPSSPGDLGALGASLSREGMVVTTIGYGLDYNEDLMVRLAQASDGNHMFAEGPEDVEKAFQKEFGDVLTVVAQEIRIQVNCASDVRPVRMLGREAEISNNSVTANISQLYAGQTKYILLETELPEGGAGGARQIASVNISFVNMLSHSSENRTLLAGPVEYVDSEATVEARTNREVAISVARQIGNENTVKAAELVDRGGSMLGVPRFVDNASELSRKAAQLNSPELAEDARKNAAFAHSDLDNNWKKERKSLREMQQSIKQQQKQ